MTHMQIARNADRTLRPLKQRSQFCEALERRLMLTTVVIDGTSGVDTWTLDAQPGMVTLNGNTLVNPVITDVQLNGFDSADTLFITLASIPVVFNGGNGNDQLFAGTGQVTDQVVGSITFNGGAGNDFADVRDESWSGSEAYVVSGSSAS